MQSKDGTVSNVVDMVEEGMPIDILDWCNDMTLEKQLSTKLTLFVIC